MALPYIIPDRAIQADFDYLQELIDAIGGGGGPPSGPAGGVLGGTYPNPGFAVDMATQAELDAHTTDVVLDGGPHGFPALTVDGMGWVRQAGALVAVDIATQAELDAVAAAKQPLDADLTAIAALATTAFGRALLTEASASTARGTLGAADSASRTAEGCGVIIHGAVAGVARPTNYFSYIWIGSVDPINSDDTKDIWINTTSFGATYQPLDADLTAIAALATTAFGRGLLTEASAATALATLGGQPLDSDLTAIAALATTAFGRALLTEATAATARTTLAAEKAISVVTALPATPADEDMILYEFTEATAPVSTRKHRWLLRYDVTANVWYPIGATPIMATVDTLETRANTAYGALTTPLTANVPLLGDYDITISASMSNNTVNDGTRMSYAVGAAAALDADAILLSVPPVNLDAQLTGIRRKTAIAAGTTIATQYKTITGGTGTWRFRTIRIAPVLISDI